MINPSAPLQTFDHRPPHGTRSFYEANRPATSADFGDDEVNYNDIHRQLMLLLNFLVSIAGVVGTLWVVARWWSTPARLFLTMGGSVVVGVSEVVVYQAYVWKMGDAKRGQGAVKEVREVVKTWVVGEEGGGEGKGDAAMIMEGEEYRDGSVRRRHVTEKSDEL
jgi:hypothetical protein